MAVLDAIDETFFDMLFVDGLSYTNGERLKQVQQTFRWQAHKTRSFSGTHICVEGVGANDDREMLILTTDRTFAAMSALFKNKWEPGFPTVKRVHRFVDYDGGVFWAVIQTRTITLQEHLHDPLTPEIANMEFNNFQAAWEDIQADPVEAPDCFGDLDIQKFCNEVDDFESRERITFKELGADDFAVDDHNPTCPKVIVTGLQKANLGDDRLSEIVASIPATSWETVGWRNPV